MSAYDYDLITIGAGSGGVRASRIAAGHGARVAIIEEDRPGGTCVLRGCVPKKLLVYGSSFSTEVEDAAGFGWEVDLPGHDWGQLIQRKNTELDRLSDIYVSLLENAGVTIIPGRGVVRDAHTVMVGDQTLTAERILVAVGGWPSLPPIEGLADHAISSNEALDLSHRPDEVVVFGSGYIAVEFAGIFNGFGAKTHLVYRADLPLRGFDDDIRKAYAEAAAGRGIILHPGASISRVEGDDEAKIITLDNGEVIHADTLMAATGRKPNTAGLGLAEAGVGLDKAGAIEVNDARQTAVPSIYAIGDVTNRINLTPVATAEGHALADTLYGGRPREVDLNDVPTAVFSQPPIATVGLAEADARKAYGRIDVYEARFRAMKNTISGRDEKTVMKMIVDHASQKVVGVHMLGPDAPEIIQGIGIAIKAGATKADFDSTIGIHPTAAEEFVTMRTPRAEN
ncbi:MAG: glutathione-disulfide reductase [Candidatus Puniceispirillales bacterium]